MKLDVSGVEVSRLSLGTASIHHKILGWARRRLLCAAFEEGITHFDTSPLYGSGLAEEDLGRFLKGRRKAVTIATKVGLFPPWPNARTGIGAWVRRGAARGLKGFNQPTVDLSVHMAERSLTKSLARLATEYVDVVFLHEPNRSMVDTEELMRWRELELSRGRVRLFGLAGVRRWVEPWVQEGHPFATLVQTKDSLSGRDADFLLEAGRPLQFTYGYFSNRTTRESVGATLAAALDRNAIGSVLFSSNNASHIRNLARQVS